MVDARHALRDILAGGAFVALGLAFGVGALSYELGTPLRMGPGYFPLVLGALLVGLGALVVIKGFLAGGAEAIGPVDWRAVALICASLVFFGVTVRGVGVVGALLGTSLLSAFARSQTSWREAIIIAVGLTVLSLVIFVFALGLRLPLVGPWIPI